MIHEGLPRPADGGYSGRHGPLGVAPRSGVDPGWPVVDGDPTTLDRGGVGVTNGADAGPFLERHGDGVWHWRRVCGGAARGRAARHAGCTSGCGRPMAGPAGVEPPYTPASPLGLYRRLYCCYLIRPKKNIGESPATFSAFSGCDPVLEDLLHSLNSRRGDATRIDNFTIPDNEAIGRTTREAVRPVLLIVGDPFESRALLARVNDPHSRVLSSPPLRPRSDVAFRRG
jgi:hypothetical protein